MFNVSFKNWTQAHWTVLCLSLGAIGAVISGLDHWSDLLKPSIFGGLLLQLVTAWRAISIAQPEPPAPDPNKVPKE